MKHYTVTYEKDGQEWGKISLYAINEKSAIVQAKDSVQGLYSIKDLNALVFTVKANN